MCCLPPSHFISSVEARTHFIATPPYPSNRRMDSRTMRNTRQQLRRPLRYVAAAALCFTGIPVTNGLTMRKSTVSVDPAAVCGSPRDLSEFMPSTRRVQTRMPSPTAAPPSSELKMICDERQEFELNLGKAVDTLKNDYPDILTCPPGMLLL